jgi:hypothetical protein
MAIFKSDPMKVLQRDIDAARSDCATLTTRLNGAEKSVIERQDEAERLACDNAEDGVLGKAEAAVRVAQDHVKNLRGGLSKKQQQIAALERDFSALIDTRTRHQTATEVATMATNLENAAKKFDTAIAELAEIAERAARFCPDARGLEAFATSSRVQVPPAVELVATVMRDYAAAVLRGEGPAMLPKPEAVMLSLAPPKPVKIRLFAMRPVKWTDAAGMQRFVHKYNDIDLSEQAAAFALRVGACVPIADPRRKQLHGTSPGHPEPNWCVDLDDAEATTIADITAPVTDLEPIKHSAFTPVDRGGPFLVKTHAGNASPNEAA